MVGPKVLEQLNQDFTMQGYNDGEAKHCSGDPGGSALAATQLQDFRLFATLQG